MNKYTPHPDFIDTSFVPDPNKKTFSSKRKKFNWAEPSDPGLFMNIPKELLRIDEEYQREQVSVEKVLRIAREWDWRLYGALSVMQRQDLTYWVYDGGHRLRAAFHRDDITTLPCLVFKVEDKSQEAKAFVGANTMKSSVSSFHAYRGSLVAGEPVAVAVDEMLSKYGFTAVQFGRGPFDFRSAGTLSALVKKNAALAEDAFHLAVDIAGGEEHVSSIVLTAVYHLGGHTEENIFINPWRSKIISLSIAGIEAAARREAHIMGSGGKAVAARAMLGLINKGKRKRLRFKSAA